MATMLHRDALPAMINESALHYMTVASFAEADRPSGDPFLAHGIKGWSFHNRRAFMNTLSPMPDVMLTFHHNAVPSDGTGARGFVLLASNAASATPAHLRLQKTFVKYLTGLDQGLREHGIINTHGSAANGPGNALMIPHYAFFENEFMNAASPDPAFTFDYQRMVLPSFIDRQAEDVVAGIVELLLDPQPNAEFDPADLGQGIAAGPVHW